MTLVEMLAAAQAKAEQGPWQPATGKHAYLNCQTDMLLTDEQARAALATC